MYLHYSFDVWDTLIKSNPDFNQARTEFFFTNYNPEGYTLEKVRLIVSDVRQMCDKTDIVTGMNINPIEVIMLILWRLGNRNITNPIDIRNSLEDIFLENPPLIYSEDTIPTLQKLKDKGTTLSILSNTSFTRGHCLNKVLINLGIIELMSFQLYSDQYDISKPSEIFYKMMMGNIRHINKRVVTRDSVCHIGDNPITDLQGALGYGIHAQLINSNDKTIIDLL